MLSLARRLRGVRAADVVWRANVGLWRRARYCRNRLPARPLKQEPPLLLPARWRRIAVGLRDTAIPPRRPPRGISRAWCYSAWKGFVSLMSRDYGESPSPRAAPTAEMESLPPDRTLTGQPRDQNLPDPSDSLSAPTLVPRPRGVSRSTRPRLSHSPALPRIRDARLFHGNPMLRFSAPSQSHACPVLLLSTPATAQGKEGSEIAIGTLLLHVNTSLAPSGGSYASVYCGSGMDPCSSSDCSIRALFARECTCIRGSGHLHYPMLQPSG